MAAAGRLSAPTPPSGAEDSTGVLGAVLRAVGAEGPVRIPSSGHVVVVAPEAARSVLTDPTAYVLPYDVARRPIRHHGPEPKETAPLPADSVRAGLAVFETELARLALPDDPRGGASDVDTLRLLRTPVARSTAAAMLPDLAEADRDRVAERVLAWVDALAPVISARRAPRSWSPIRRAEVRARRALVADLVAAGADGAPALATALAAGVQVPVAAGAWLLTQLAARPALQDDLRRDADLALPVAWEVLRLYPPTWVLPRITSTDVVLAGTEVPAYTPVLVSPLGLGRLERLVPGPAAGCAPLDELDPMRWVVSARRPGAWLPFGAGPHACPGRNLGLGQLTTLAGWARSLDLHRDQAPAVDAERGLSPSPSTVRARRRVLPA